MSDNLLVNIRISMMKQRQLLTRLLALASIWLILLQNGPVRAGSIAPDFVLKTAVSGVTLYEKTIFTGYHQYVQIIHLNQGASVQLRHGPIAQPGTGEGDYGGDNPLIFTQAITDIWAEFHPQQPDTFCLTNGQFYSSHASAVRLSFPVKADGHLISSGYGRDQFPGDQLLLEIWPHQATIRPMSEAALLTSTAPNLLVGLTEEAAGRRPNARTGRTFIGVGNPNEAGFYQSLLIFSSQSARKTDAVTTLSQFGAERVMMLDGGASTQLICEGELLLGPGRYIPQAIAILPAPMLPILPNCQVNGLTHWPDNQRLLC